MQQATTCIKATLAALLVFGVTPKAADAMILQGDFSGIVGRVGTPAVNFDFTLDTSKVSGTTSVGACGGSYTNPQFGGLDTGFNLSGGVSNASISIAGVGSSDVLQSATFTYYSDDVSACTFWSDMYLNFGSGLSVNLLFTPVGYGLFDFPQNMPPTASSTTTSQLLTDVLTLTYNGTQPVTDSMIIVDGQDLGTFNGKAQVVSVPEPGTLALMVAALAGFGLVRLKFRKV